MSFTRSQVMEDEVLIPKAGYRDKEMRKAREDEAEAVMVSPAPSRTRAKREHL